MLKILIVDDSEIVLEVLRRTLEDAGFAAAAIASAFQLNQAIHDESPDLILLDVNMPALRGDKAAKILKKHAFSREIPVLLHSELEESELADLVVETGAAGYVPKTTNRQALVSQIRHWLVRLGHPQAAAAPPPAPPPAEVPSLPPSLESPLVDHLSDMQDSWGPETLEQLSEMFSDQWSRLEELERAVAADDPATVVETAHFLKGTARTLGAGRLAGLFYQLETCGRERDLGNTEHLLTALKKEWRQVAEVFRLLAAQGSPT